MEYYTHCQPRLVLCRNTGSHFVSSPQFPAFSPFPPLRLTGPPPPPPLPTPPHHRPPEEMLSCLDNGVPFPWCFPLRVGISHSFPRNNSTRLLSCPGLPLFLMAARQTRKAIGEGFLHLKKKEKGVFPFQIDKDTKITKYNKL